jgi:enoyl-CoA hydratase
MPYETIVLDREETYAVITLNRPPANAISDTLMRELNAALSDVEADGAVRSVIITGGGRQDLLRGRRSRQCLLGARRGDLHPLRQ